MFADKVFLSVRSTSARCLLRPVVCFVCFRPLPTRWRLRQSSSLGRPPHLFSTAGCGTLTWESFFCLLQSSVFSNQYFRHVCVWLAALQSRGNAFQRAANHERRRPMRQQKQAHLCFYTPPLALRLSLSQRSAAFV